MIGVGCRPGGQRKTSGSGNLCHVQRGKSHGADPQLRGISPSDVKIVGTHAGISVGEDGASHQCNEDCAAMRSIPGMTVICPADHYETQAAVKAMLDYQGPVYLRLGRLPVECVNREEDYTFTIGKSILKKDGSDATVIAVGSMVYEALKAANLLERRGGSASAS